MSELENKVQDALNKSNYADYVYAYYFLEELEKSGYCVVPLVMTYDMQNAYLTARNSYLMARTNSSGYNEVWGEVLKARPR